jgi:glutathione S-transferase
VEIFDSTQIFEYFEHVQPHPPLWPAAPASRARARLLELKSDEVFFPQVIRLMGLEGRLDEPPAQEAIAHLHRYYGELEALLTERDYLCGDYTYADIAFFMAQIFAARKGAPMAEATPRLLDWRRRVAARPAVQPTLVQMIRTLTRQRHPVPQFMSDAVHGRTA